MFNTILAKKSSSSTSERILVWASGGYVYSCTNKGFPFWVLNLILYRNIQWMKTKLFVDIILPPVSDFEAGSNRLRTTSKCN